MKRKLKTLLLLFATVAMSASMFSSCGGDDDEPGSGNGQPSSSSMTSLVGTWSRDVQWAGTEGLRQTIYKFQSNGYGELSEWNWLEQEYYYWPYEWSADKESITLHYTTTVQGDYEMPSYQMFYYELLDNGKTLDLYMSNGKPYYTFYKQ